MAQFRRKQEEHLSGGGVGGGNEILWVAGAIVAGLIMTMVGVIQLWYGHRIVGGVLLLPAAIVVCFMAWAALRGTLQSMGKR